MALLAPGLIALPLASSVSRFAQNKSTNAYSTYPDRIELWSDCESQISATVEAGLAQIPNDSSFENERPRPVLIGSEATAVAELHACGLQRVMQLLRAQNLDYAFHFQHLCEPVLEAVPAGKPDAV